MASASRGRSMVTTLTLLRLRRWRCIPDRAGCAHDRSRGWWSAVGRRVAAWWQNQDRNRRSAQGQEDAAAQRGGGVAVGEHRLESGGVVRRR